MKNKFETWLLSRKRIAQAEIERAMEKVLEAEAKRIQEKRQTDTGDSL